jgi:EmrB/QacA subfamily drug resistance transporter
MKRYRIVSLKANQEAEMASDSADKRRWWALVVVSLGLLTISLDNTILNVALPSIATDLGASGGELQWIVDAYTLVFAGLVLSAGSLGDRFGRRRALVVGLVVFAGGSLAAALSAAPGALTASRAFMGIGAALVMPTTLSVITNVFPARERAKAIGIWAAVAGVGVAIGPIAGGFLLEHFSWGSVFLINLPVAAIVLLGAAFFVPESRDPEASRLDPVGAGLSIAGLTTLVWSIIEAPERGWTDPVILGALGVSVALLVAFARWELHTDSPMLNVRLFRLGAFSGASGAVALAFFALFGTIFFLTQYLQEVLDYTALEAGVRTLPVAGGLILGGPLSARIAERLGARRVVAAGLVIVAGGLSLLSTVDVSSGYGLVAASMAIFGVGMGAAMAPSTESIMSTLPLAHAGVGSAMNDTTRMVGGTLGVAVLGSLLSSGYGADMERVTAGLDPRAAEFAGESIGAAGRVAERIGGEAGAALSQAADGAFVSAMSTALTAGAGVALAGAVFALVVMPRREREPRASVTEAVPA